MNVIAHQFLIPMVQVGAKVETTDTGNVGRVFSVLRPVTPDSGCLTCAGLVDLTKLALEALPNLQQRDADYGTGEHAPSVITLNGIAVSQAITHLVFALTGLRLADHDDYTRYDARTSTTKRSEPYRSPDCSVSGHAGVVGLGDLRPLPLPRNQ